MKDSLLHCFVPASNDYLKSLPTDISAVINSNIDLNARALLEAESIKYYAWESDFISAIHKGDLVPKACLATPEIIKGLDSLDIEFLSEMYKRTLYADFILMSTSLNWYYQYFIGIIECHSVRKIICKAVPHSFGDYALVAISKALGLSVIGCLPFFGWSTKLFAAYSFNRNRYIIPNRATEPGLSADSQAVKDTIRQALDSSSGKCSYPYEDKLNGVIDIGRSVFMREALAMLKTPGPEPYLPILNKIASIKQTIAKNLVNKLPDKYAVLFLSYEPEASLTPMGGNFWNQKIYAKVCSTICQQLGIPLIIREHPDVTKFPFERAQDISHYFLSPEKFSRSGSFYSYLLSLPQVIGFDVSRLADLLSSSSLQMIFTISGSISLEAFLAKKVVVAGGSTPLHNGSNVISLSDISGEEGVEMSMVVDKLQRLIDTPSTFQVKAALADCLCQYAITPNSVADGIAIGRYM